MGMIYKRGKTYWIKYYRNGKPYRESTKSKKEADAKRLLKKREGEISEGKLPGIYFDRVKFDELAQDLLTDYKVNGLKSIDRAELSILHLSENFGGARVPDIDTPAIKRYIERRRTESRCKVCKKRFAETDRCPFCNSKDLRSPAANATINRELSALKAMLKMGERQTPPKVNRLPYIPMLKENNVRKGFFEHDQFLVIREALPEYLKGYATFAYKIGWRKEEIAELTWSQIDRQNWIVRLEPGETKNDDARTIYLDEELKGYFISQWDKRRNGKKILPYVFPNTEAAGKIKDFRRVWRSACKDAGIGNKIFHDFRRTAIRNMIRAGIPERVAMMISGHKTRSVFDRYNIVNDTDLKLASQRQEAYLKSQMGTVSGTISQIHDSAKKEGSTDNG